MTKYDLAERIIHYECHGQSICTINNNDPDLYKELMTAVIAQLDGTMTESGNDIGYLGFALDKF